MDHDTPLSVIGIDAARAYELLQAVVRNAGENYTDPSYAARRTCVYQRDGKPSCIVGHALVLADVSLSGLQYMDAQRNEGSMCEKKCGSCDFCVSGSSAIRDVVLPKGLQITSDARAVLGSAQSLQDAGRTWGEALQAAQKVATYQQNSRQPDAGGV